MEVIRVFGLPPTFDMRVAIQLCPRYEACVLFAHQVSSLAMSSGTDDRRLLLRLAVCVSIYVTLTSGAPVRDAEAIGQVEATVSDQQPLSAQFYRRRTFRFSLDDVMI